MALTWKEQQYYPNGSEIKYNHKRKFTLKLCSSALQKSRFLTRPSHGVPWCTFSPQGLGHRGCTECPLPGQRPTVFAITLQLQTTLHGTISIRKSVSWARLGLQGTVSHTGPPDNQDYFSLELSPQQSGKHSATHVGKQIPTSQT